MTEPRPSRRRFKSLSPKDVHRSPSLSFLEFNTTDDLKTLSGVIEQDRAVSSLELGLSIKRRNYNVYVAGESGTGKTTLVRTQLDTIAKSRPTPPDWICVHNYKDPSAPRCISMPPGTALGFRDGMAALIERLREQVPKVFHSKEHQEKVQSILNESLDRENGCFLELSKQAQAVGFTIKSTKTGIVTIPMLDDKIISNKDYAHLTEEERRQIEGARKELDPHISSFLQKTRDIEVETHTAIQSLQRGLGQQVAGHRFEELRKKYAEQEQVITYLDAAFENFLDNLNRFLPDESDPGEVREIQKKPLTEYVINVLVDHSGIDGAPVIFENRPNWSNLFGKIERRLENGVYFTDFTLIRSGSLLRASGGYLIVNVLDLFQQPGVWDQLKSCLRNREVAIEDPGMLSPFLPTTGLKPEAIPVDPKIILVGSAWAYYLLYNADEDFRRIFQVLADFDVEIDATRRTVREYAQFIATTCRNDELLPMDRDGVSAVIEHGLRLADHQKRLTLKFNDIATLVIEADHHARRRKKATVITRDDVMTALAARTRRNSLLADKLHREIQDGRTMITIQGSVIGQVNGLAVYSLGESRFGTPTRITANAWAGRSGVVNIEREAKLSGEIHDKGVYIITGFLGQTYGREKPIELSATLCFEQSYGGVDGDSASSAELFALLSALADLPLKQSVAVTGSVNQKGEIQPIGGVNEKIEGFFDVCSDRGLTGEQGVIIPHQNIRNLMLKHDVRQAIENGTFHVWPIKTINDGIEILTGVVAGQPNGAKNTVHGLVSQRLEQFRGAGQSDNDDK
ncbi:MAG: ATP-binding protein [Myxococcota bacterium]|nr:ATP-binding protein [Myxococcota bacterium]